MDITGICSLYRDDPPYTWECKDTSRGEDDFRRTVFAQWEDRGLAIKIACNDFTTPHRVEIWRKTAAAYRAMGYDCPQIIADRHGNAAETVSYEGRPCVVYAEELAQFQTAEQFGERVILQNGRYIYHNDALQFLCEVGSAGLDFGDFPSGLCILERFCPSDPCDEIMKCALEFKEIIEGQLPQYIERFQRIWSRFLANRGALEQIYSQLPASVFQADLNPGNILLDHDMRFAGVLDLNLTGRDTALNVFFRELWINFDEDIPDKRENNMYYVEENSKRALQSFLDDLSLMKNSYHFTQAEKESAPLLYRYLRPFWWRPLHALKRDQGDPAKVGQILSWIETEQSRSIDFDGIMAGGPCGTD